MGFACAYIIVFNVIYCSLSPGGEGIDDELFLLGVPWNDDICLFAVLVEEDS
jgi:hypothetical protein